MGKKLLLVVNRDFVNLEDLEQLRKLKYDYVLVDDVKAISAVQESSFKERVFLAALPIFLTLSADNCLSWDKSALDAVQHAAMVAHVACEKMEPK